MIVKSNTVETLIRKDEYAKAGTKGADRMDVKSYTADPSTLRRVEEIRAYLKREFPDLPPREYCDSAIIRRSVAFLHRYAVDRESMIHPDDPRYEL